jgi:hypothetical protein
MNQNQQSSATKPTISPLYENMQLHRKHWKKLQAALEQFHKGEAPAETNFLVMFLPTCFCFIFVLADGT